MKCNIDNRGRRVRFIGGLIAMLAGVFLLVVVPQDWWAWATAFVLFIAGLLQMYEAWKGWCALRAMGIRTPW